MMSAERKGGQWGGREETREEMKVERDERRKGKKICQYLKKKSHGKMLLAKSAYD